MNEPTRNEIIRRWHEGQSMRGIAGDLQLSRETVKRAIEQHRRDRQHDFTESQDFENTLRQHLRAFEHLGGVAATCLYDNMKVVVSRYEDGQPVYNPRFLAFATHYGYRPIACRVRRPQTKGKVERPFDYVEKNLLNGRQFRSLEHLNDVTAWWLQNVANVRVHRTTKQRPVDRHAQEQPHLIPLPEQPYEVAEMLYRTVDVEGFISWRQNRYSVPWQATRPGQMLPVKITEEEVIIYGTQIEEIARHRRLPPTVTHQDCQQKSHRPPRDLERRRELLEQRFGELGEVAVQFLKGLRQSQHHGWVQAEGVLALLGTYRRADLLAALERAMQYGAYSLKSVQRILAVQAQPKTSLEQLAEESRQHLSPLLTDDPTPPRPASDYQKLLFSESETSDQDSPNHEQTNQQDPGEQDPGEQDPGEQDPGEQDPGEQDPGEQDPGEDESEQQDFGGQDSGRES